MGAIERAQAAVKKYRGNPNGFTKRITFVKADGSVSAIVYGMHSKIYMTINTLGESVNTKRPHVSIAESSLIDAGYPTRNSDGEVSLKDDNVFVDDSTGATCKYVIREIFPDETLGLLICFLNDAE